MATIKTRETQDSVKRVCHILEPSDERTFQSFTALLHRGFAVGNLVTSDVVHSLGLIGNIYHCNKVLGSCSDGHELRSIGTIKLQWRLDNPYIIVDSLFYVIQGGSTNWGIVLGASTCDKFQLFSSAALGYCPGHHVNSTAEERRDGLTISRLTGEFATEEMGIAMESLSLSSGNVKCVNTFNKSHLEQNDNSVDERVSIFLSGGE